MLEFLVHLEANSNTLLHRSLLAATQIYLASQYVDAKLLNPTSAIAANSGLGHIAIRTWPVGIAS